MAFSLIPFLIILLVFYSGASLNVANRMCELSKFGGKLPALQFEVFKCSTPGMDGAAIFSTGAKIWSAETENW